MSAQLRIEVHRIAYSTNVERVAIAAAHKGVAVDWIDVDPSERSAVVALSGQDLVPVMRAPSGEVIADSTAILRWLELNAPQPALWPADPAARAQADIAVEWFNGAWKGPPNAIEAELSGASPDEDRIARWSRELAGWLERFDALLSDHEYLLGETLGILDVCAFPFLKYGLTAPDAADDELFHHVLHDHQRGAGQLPRLAAWIRRVDALPRA